MTSCLPREKGSGWLLFYLAGICPCLLLRASAREWITRVNLGRPCRQGQDWTGEGRKEMDQQEELQEERGFLLTPRRDAEVAFWNPVREERETGGVREMEGGIPAWPSWGKQEEEATDCKPVLQLGMWRQVAYEESANVGLLLGPRLPIPHSDQAEVEETDTC